ncbi:MAG: MerR family transcriptional regulator, partial [Actinobacteria bacterium]|nr:MerR family transcriptional regulator [Actinomycetota bacterium]
MHPQTLRMYERRGLIEPKRTTGNSRRYSQQDVERLEETEEMKAWMALGARDKSALLTYPQLLRVVDHNWKNDFGQVVRDKTLVNQARAVAHLRNTLCHMS